MFGTMEVISFLTDPFMILIDRIMSLKPVKIRTKQWAFKEIVEPLFMGFQTVIGNYFLVLRTTQQHLIEGNQEDLQKSIKSLRYTREAIQISRKRAQKMCYRIGELSNDLMIIDFSKNVERFYYQTVFEEILEETALSKRMQLAEIIDYATNLINKPEILKDLCVNVEDHYRKVSNNILKDITATTVQIEIIESHPQYSYLSLENLHRFRNDPMEFFIAVLLIDLEYSWERIAKSYAQTRIHCLSFSGQ